MNKKIITLNFEIMDFNLISLKMKFL